MTSDATDTRFTLNKNLSTNNYKVDYSCFDNIYETYNTASQNFRVYLPLTPLIFLNSPANNLITNNQIINFNCSAVNDVELKNISLYINNVLNATELFSGIIGGELTRTYTLPFGNYNWSCSCRDSDNLENVSETRLFNIYPQLLTTIYSPSNTTYSSLSVLLNISTSNNALCNFSVNNETTNYTMINLSDTEFYETAIFLSDGNYKINYNCIDIYNQFNLSSVDFAIVTPVIPPTETSGQQIFNILSSSGAGLGKFIQIIAIPLFILMIIFIIIIIIIAISKPLANFFKNLNIIELK
jgi:hypothetical protein